MTTRMAFTARSFLLRLACRSDDRFAFALLLRAGGPKYVAGTSYFDSTMTGQPLIWPLGVITYYTDQGDLSPILPNASANCSGRQCLQPVDRCSHCGLAATSGGQLAEDVNGTNVTVNSDGSISMPADIQPTATGTPVGVVYDYDGSVTDALMGSGAGGTSQCFFNAVFGGNDNYGALATYQHALIVINGQCAQQSSQLTDIEYRLVRVIGSVLGLGWSQVNPNVLTGSPAATSDDYAGFPVMHFTDSGRLRAHYDLLCQSLSAVRWMMPRPSRGCIRSLRRISRTFPASRFFLRHGARIHGSVWFTDLREIATQPMQGVNVVARWIDPTDRAALAQVCCDVRSPVSVHRKCWQSHHRLRRRVGRSLRRVGIANPDRRRLLRPCRTCNCPMAAARNIS